MRSGREYNFVRNRSAVANNLRKDHDRIDDKKISIEKSIG